MKLLTRTVFCLFSFSLIYGEASIEEVFTDIYDSQIWGADAEGNGTSGTGSTLDHTVEYRAFLQDFLKNQKIHSVVDVGCGDWGFSCAIDWSGIRYKGYDVVASVIQKNIEKYSSANISFILGNAINMKLPRADLLICKDVLQHLTIRDISQFTKQFRRFKYCLITNDLYYIGYEGFQVNQEIRTGEVRPLDLSKPPFSLVGQGVLLYKEKDLPNVKQVFLIIN